MIFPILVLIFPIPVYEKFPNVKEKSLYACMGHLKVRMEEKSYFHRANEFSG